MAKINQPTQGSILRKEYKNAIGRDTPKAITLDFTLRQDITDELIGFLHLLKQATLEVENDLKRLQQERKRK